MVGSQVEENAKYLTIICDKTSCSRGNAFVSGAGGLRLKSRAGQIKHNAAHSSLPLQHFFERSCAARAQ